MSQVASCVARAFGKPGSVCAHVVGLFFLFLFRYDVFVFNVYVKAAIQQRRQQSRAEQDPFSAEYVPFDVLVSTFPWRCIQASRLVWRHGMQHGSIVGAL